MYLLYAAKGFLINTINPFVFIYWVGAVSFITLEPDYKKSDLFFFFVAAVCSNFIFDVSKSFLASKVKHLLTHRLMVRVSRIVGVAIILLGVRLLWKTLLM